MLAESDPDDDEGLPRPGDLIAGKLRIERVIGRGGMGVVYSAHHELLGQRVAIKVLLPAVASNKEVVARFLNEARAAASIEGEHVARVLDVATFDHGSPYMVIEYLDGADLGQILQTRGPLPVVEAVDYVLQALEALAQAHARGIVHRDFKPSNLFLARRSDGTTLVKVLDFGIAKATQPLNLPENASMTRSNAVLGSPQYMSPEQLRNAKTVDARADIWSVGLTLYELLTGAPPFAGTTFGELFAAILEDTAAPIAGKRPDVDARLDAVVARCLRRDPKGRFPTVADLAHALASHGSERATQSLRRIISVLPPPMTTDAVVITAVGSGPVEPHVATSLSVPSFAEGTAPPISSTHANGITPARRGASMTGVLVVVALLVAVGVGVMKARSAQPPVASAAAPAAPAVPEELPASLAASASPSPAASARPAAPQSAAPLAPSLSPAPTVVLTPLPSATSLAPRANAANAASANAGIVRPAARSSETSAEPSAKTRADQTGLAGDNPFR